MGWLPFITWTERPEKPSTALGAVRLNPASRAVLEAVLFYIQPKASKGCRRLKKWVCHTAYPISIYE